MKWIVTRFFSTKGRVSRKEYIFSIISNLFLLVAICSSCAMIINKLPDYKGSVRFIIVFGPLFFVMISYIQSIFVTVRRLHDLNRPGGHYFLSFIPLYNIYLASLLVFMPGTCGRNDYGEDPIGCSSHLFGSARKY